jgi:hypothetical protein
LTPEWGTGFMLGLRKEIQMKKPKAKCCEKCICPGPCGENCDPKCTCGCPCCKKK